MWRVDKVHDGEEADRTEIPQAIRDALVRWYAREGSQADERQAVALVIDTKACLQWLACDCLGENGPPPLLSPAYLTEAETFYLRRLVGGERNRPEHASSCPFFREQQLDPKVARLLPAKPLTAPAGWFSLYKPVGEHLAQVPEEDAEPRARHRSTPRLARLLWHLVDSAGTNVLAPIKGRSPPAIALEFEKLRNAAADLEIAPGVPLARHFHTHPRDYHSKAVFARLREADWPHGHERQAFLALFASHVERHEIRFASGEPLVTAQDIGRPPLKAVDRGPYLVLVAIAHHARARGFAAVRAYAQPIYDGRHFIPVDSQDERVALKYLIETQWRLHRDGIAVRIKKPVFDVESEDGPCRPGFALAMTRANGTRANLIVDIVASETAGSAEARERRTRMETLAPVLVIDPSEFAEPGRLLDRLAAAIRQA